MPEEIKHERETVQVPPTVGQDRVSYYTHCSCGDPKCEEYKND